ncbi:MAG: metallophosphoesterase family protein [Patescibacteria group bacterium]|nr:metallophosphoesterase family protein [Patescibacteria group bacterium]
MSECHTLLISDIHLGSKVCQADKVLWVLRETKFKDLIINGDLFDTNSTEHFDGKHWEIVMAISEIAEKHSAVLVGGNHGRKLDSLAKKMGLRIYDNHAFGVGGRRFLCLHGNEFDVFVRYMPNISDFFTWLYYFIQRFGGQKQRVSMFLKRFSKHILGVSRLQQKRAIEFGTAMNANVVICSHTHLPHVSRQANGLLFVNSGSFCAHPCNYVTIDRSGKVELKEV